MTARTALTPSVFVADNSLADPAGTSIAALVTPGATVAAPGPWKAMIRVANSDTGPHNFTLRAGGSGVTASGAAAVPTPYTQAQVGDLVTAVAASSTVWIGPLTTDRFTQADGSMSLDFAAGFVGTVTVFQLPNETL